MEAPKLETYKKAALRALESGIASALVVFAFIPINLEDPKRYIMAVGFGMAAGFLTGVSKFIRGYIKYDK